jgi:hypothetical protein
VLLPSPHIKLALAYGSHPDLKAETFVLHSQIIKGLGNKVSSMYLKSTLALTFASQSTIEHAV